jgi:hypothetical protein
MKGRPYYPKLNEETLVLHAYRDGVKTGDIVKVAWLDGKWIVLDRVKSKGEQAV